LAKRDLKWTFFNRIIQERLQPKREGVEEEHSRGALGMAGKGEQGISHRCSKAREEIGSGNHGGKGAQQESAFRIKGAKDHQSPDDSLKRGEGGPEKKLTLKTAGDRGLGCSTLWASGG